MCKKAFFIQHNPIYFNIFYLNMESLILTKKLMKNLLLLLVTLSLSCCSKDDNKPVNPIDQLPPATQTGANTAGCLVDGKAFLPKGYIPSGNLVCNYINGKDFVISIIQKKDNQTFLIDVTSYNT
jgi:hypothetical protein